MILTLSFKIFNGISGHSSTEMFRIQ